MLVGRWRFGNEDKARNIGPLTSAQTRREICGGELPFTTIYCRGTGQGLCRQVISACQAVDETAAINS